MGFWLVYADRCMVRFVRVRMESATPPSLRTSGSSGPLGGNYLVTQQRGAPHKMREMVVEQFESGTVHGGFGGRRVAQGLEQGRRDLPFLQVCRFAVWTQ